MSTKQQGEAIRAALPQLRAALEHAYAAKERRRAELLKDPLYRQLVTHWAAADRAYTDAALRVVAD